jgi:hypothetical protein
LVPDIQTSLGNPCNLTKKRRQIDLWFTITQ